MQEIKHIIFDIGKVLLHWDPQIPYRHLIPDEDKRRWFFDNVCTSSWNEEQDKGRPWAEAEALLIEQFPDQEDLICAYRKHWHEMVPHAIEGSVEILEDLVNGGMDVTMLTNFAADTFLEAQQRFPFLTIGRGVTVSGVVGLIKPDPEIYLRHEQSFDLKPTACLFIDDSAPNIASARARGWQGILFSSPELLKEDLRAFL